jgi:hypothetical protein
MGAGSGGGNTVIRSLKTGDPSLAIVGCHADRFALKQSLADRNYLIRPARHPQFTASLRRVIERERVDLLIPESDGNVAEVGRQRKKLPCRLFLPRNSVIDVCQDKLRLTNFLGMRALPVPVSYAVTNEQGIARAFRRLRTRPVWCRIRRGSGSAGAIPVKSVEMARFWILYWKAMRGVPASAFTLSEYLPGRDFACQSLWRDGTLVLMKTCERLSYFWGDNHPSGSSSIASLAKTCREPAVADLCSRAVRALDPRASGAFSLDLKEDARGVPHITEVNVGRLLTGTAIFDRAGKHNMALTYVRLALEESVEIREEYDTTDDYYMVRDLDTIPGVFHAAEFFSGIQDARCSLGRNPSGDSDA